MPNLVSQLLPKLEANRLPGLDAGAQAFYPNYADQSLANLPASICRWLGVPQFGLPPVAEPILSAFDGPFRNVILLLVDGLGLGQFERFIEISQRATGRFNIWQRLLSQSTLAPLTSIVPATTSAALTTLWTGRTPAEHGVVGYEVFLKEYGLIANMITHSPSSFVGDVGGLKRAGFQAETFLPVPTLGPHLAAHGVHPYAFQHLSISRSGLSTMLFPGVTVLPYRTQSDLWVSVPAFLQNHPSERMFTQVYWGELDELAHRFGPQDRRVDLEFANFSFLIEYFLNELQEHAHGDTLLLMTADHGHLHTPAYAHYELKNHPELASCLHMNPCGENRLAFLYLRPGKETQVREYIQNTFPGEFAVLPAEQVIASGLMGSGQPHPRLAERLGDLVLIAQGDAYLWWADKENLMLGRHGGMSRTEMLVPLLGMVI